MGNKYKDGAGSKVNFSYPRMSLLSQAFVHGTKTKIEPLLAFGFLPPPRLSAHLSVLGH